MTKKTKWLFYNTVYNLYANYIYMWATNSVKQHGL